MRTISRKIFTSHVQVMERSGVLGHVEMRSSNRRGNFLEFSMEAGLIFWMLWTQIHLLNCNHPAR
jgi:hypothetical protein